MRNASPSFQLSPVVSAAYFSLLLVFVSKQWHARFSQMSFVEEAWFTACSARLWQLAVCRSASEYVLRLAGAIATWLN